MQYVRNEVLKLKSLTVFILVNDLLLYYSISFTYVSSIAVMPVLGRACCCNDDDEDDDDNDHDDNNI